MRDEFAGLTKTVLAQRVGTLCSNPDCSRATFGPNMAGGKRSCIGVAAHITAAQPGGPRFDSTLSQEKRGSIENGIWLCQSCARLIDMDPDRYPVHVLRHWKKQAEDRAREALEQPSLIQTEDVIDTGTILLVTRQVAFVPFSAPAAPKGMVSSMSVTLKPVIAPHDLKPNRLAITLRNDPIPEGTCFLTCQVQNLGDAVDTNVRVTVRCHTAPLVLEKVWQPQRMSLIGGGKKGSSYIDLAIPTLLPKETQAATLFAKAGAEIDLRLWTELSRVSANVFLFDMVPGGWKFVPRKSSPFKRQIAVESGLANEH